MCVLTIFSLIGGGLVLLLGLTYIAFEKSLLVQATPVQKGLASTKIDNLSRTIFGVQVGLVALSMIVTRSSIKYLQAKQGLPLGTQMVGWATLSTLICSAVLSTIMLTKS